MFARPTFVGINALVSDDDRGGHCFRAASAFSFLLPPPGCRGGSPAAPLSMVLTSFAGRNKLGERLIKPCLVEDHNDAPQNHGYFGPGSPLRRPLIFVGAPDNSDYRGQKYPAVKFSFGQRPRNPLKIELRNWVRKEIGPIASPNLIQFAPGLPKDFNVVPTDADIYPTKSYAKNALVQLKPRALFRRLLDRGWITRSARFTLMSRCTRSGIQAKPLATRCRASP